MSFDDNLRSFNENWSIDFLTPRDMVAANFYYTGIGDKVKCSKCNIELGNWKQGDDPVQFHIRFSPICSFVYEILYTVDGRLSTFNNWPVPFLKPIQMAEAGFYFLGFEDSVKCFKCKRHFDSWKKGDIPILEHYRNSFLCPYVKGYEDMFDVCGFYRTSIADLQINLWAKQIEDLLNAEGIMLKLKPIKRSKMATFDARLKSFNKWPKKLNLNINTLSEAGFFYTGNGRNDYTTCFFCDEILCQWTDDDEPWTEHAKWSKKCSYVLLNKGKHFVDQVCNVENDISNQLELYTLISEQKYTYLSGSKMKIQAKKININELQITKILSDKKKDHRSQILDPNSVPDCMLCKICYKEEIKVVFVPCGHAVACLQCAFTLEMCAICRYPFSKLIRVYLCMDKKIDEDLKLVPCSSKMSSNNTLRSMLCKVCHKEELAAIFIPCRHVYTCIKCAEELDNCPICGENIFALIQLYL
uniref:Apoptosis inhibitor IAP n=1 Tax=Schizaphis graminum TaxID=13262 RepID=A0A2S2P3Z9_SCHGA